MNIYMNFNDLIGWILVGGGLAIAAIMLLTAWIMYKVQEFKEWIAKKKREKEASGESDEL